MNVFFALAMTLGAGLINAVLSQLLRMVPEDRSQRGWYMMLFALLNVVCSFALAHATGYDPGSMEFALVAAGGGVFTLVNFVAVVVALKMGPISILWPLAWLSAPIAGVGFSAASGFNDFNLFYALGIAAFLAALALLYFSNREDKTAKAGFFLLAMVALVTGIGANFLYKYALTDPPFRTGNTLTYMFFNIIGTHTGLAIYGAIPLKIKVGLRTTLVAFVCFALGLAQFFMSTTAISHLSGTVFMCSFAGSAILFSVMFAAIIQGEKITFLKAASIVAILAAITFFALSQNA